MKKVALLAALSGSMLAGTATVSFADYTLNILHINDWHSRIESNNRFESTCSAEEETKGECFGGAARLVTAIAEKRKALEGQNVVLLNAGDNFQGSLFYATYKGAAEGEFLNQMKFDVMTVGNHEFDDGEPALAAFLDKANYPLISSNVIASLKSRLGDRIKPHIVLDVGGEKIGVIGATPNDTAELASPGPEILIADDAAGIRQSVEALTKEGVDKIIVLSHVGYQRDIDTIAKIPGVDVVVGGHSHTVLSNTDPKAAGPYPTMIDNPDGHKVPVVTAGSYSKYLGDLVVTFDDAGVVKEAKGEPMLLDKSVAPDPQVLARVAELAKPIEELKAKVVAEAAEAIDGDRNNCRVKECSMGNLVADATLDRVKDQGITIAIANGGGLRASIDAGPVTMGEVLTVLPFQNTLATFQVTGKDLVASLEQGVSEIEGIKGKFPQVAGLRYTFDKSVAPNEGRIKSVEVKEGDGWVAVDPAKVYGVVTNNFVRGGGDGYKLFASNAQNAYDYGPGLEQVVADYLAKNSPYKPVVEGRITDATPASAAAPAPAAPAAPAPATAAPAPAAPATAAPATAEPAIKLPDLPAASNEIAMQAPKVDAAPPAAAPAPAEAAAPAPAADAKPAEVAAAPAAAAPAAASAARTYTVKAGDSFWKIAAELYGDGAKWPLLAEANKQMKAKALVVGAELAVPAAN